MHLTKLLDNIVDLPEKANCDFRALCLNSQQLLPRDVFIAFQGTAKDGKEYIPAAISKGAIAIIHDAPTQPVVRWQENIPLISLPEIKQCLGMLAARYYAYPAKKMRMVGVTGTNGKTSSTHFIAELMTICGERCGMIGTLGHGFPGQLTGTGLTTPDPISLHGIFNELLQQKAQAIAMEVSSHSIHQGRVNDIEFDVGIFTNLTQDHLDYHGDMQSYASVKRHFIVEMPVKTRVINAEDEYGLSLLHELRDAPSVFAYATKKIPTPVPLIYTEQVQLSLHGIRARVYTPWGEGDLSLGLLGQFNLSNALAAITTLCALRFPFKTVLEGLSEIKPVPGRMQILGRANKPLVVVDYSHTPDALKKALEALRGHTKGKLWCVFGCGGNRDPGKRSVMANVAESYADHIIVTNDNPRHEIPERIIEDICKGFSDLNKVNIELDRSKAIQNSIQWATSSDCILIAGKGAETYQQIGDEKFPFSDIEVVESGLLAL